MTDEKIICRTPNAKGTTRIPRWKFETIHAAILAALDDAGPSGLAFSDLSEDVESRLSRDELERLGSVGWHVTSVKLELEVRGEIIRVAGETPQRLTRGSRA